MTKDTTKPRAAAVDWLIVEKDYRAGIKNLRQIGTENGVTEGAIRKRAKRDGWTRDLGARIQAKAEDLVRKEEVRKVGTQTNLDVPTERQVVEANAHAVAHVDLTNRKDVLRGMDVSRQHIEELAALNDPTFRDRLVWLGEVMDESGVDDETGKLVKDKANELYRYIIDMPGRVKMAKEVAAAVGVYVPMMRKIYKLDAEAKEGASSIEDLLRAMGAAS
ncbi:MAG: hypothetical protein ACMV1D_07915 [Macromonas sp.]